MESDLIVEIERRFKMMPLKDRVIEIRQFMLSSHVHWNVIRDRFPELFQEALDGYRN